MSTDSQTPAPTDLEAFYSFVGQSLKQGQKDAAPESMLQRWRAEREMEETCAAIQAGMDDIEAGRCRPLEEFDAEFRKKNGLPPRGRS
jgi:hypothetical protein